nr:MAG TPA: hypothetical protein [Caudoviricetes sp.]DAS57591.1 MAG TPA: hypothetical protein [Caudoviricetes sp.]
MEVAVFQDIIFSNEFQSIGHLTILLRIAFSEVRISL